MNQILGHGIDVVATARFQKMLKNKNWNFFHKIFTPKEMQDCTHKANAAQKFAARFAAKEAFMKALGTGWVKGISFKEIEISTQASGEPKITLFGKAKGFSQNKKIKKIFLSFSHEENISMASVILVGV